MRFNTSPQPYPQKEREINLVNSIAHSTLFKRRGNTCPFSWRGEGQDEVDGTRSKLATPKQTTKSPSYQEGLFNIFEQELEVQTSFSSSICQSRNSTVIQETASVEYTLVDASFKSFLSNSFTNSFSSFNVTAVAQFFS